MLDKDELKRLRDSPIEGVAARLGLQVVRHRCLCPFHNDQRHPNLSFHTGRNTFRCWSCQAKGDPLDLVQKVLGLGFVDAARWLADQSNVILTTWKPTPDPPPRPFDAQRYQRYFEHPWLSPEARRFLYDERRIDPDVVRRCRLTSWRDREGVSWLQIPYYGREGELIGVQNRNLGLATAEKPRFRFVVGCRPTMYNQQVLRDVAPGSDVWIAEGCSDCWALMSAPGHGQAIAIPSATLLTAPDKQLLASLAQERAITFHMAPDQDEPGRKLFEEIRAVLPGLVRHELPEGCKDVGEWWKERANRPTPVPSLMEGSR